MSRFFASLRMTTKKINNINPILSIIILNYNSGNYLSQCLESIYKSILTFPIEVIIVDNASTDNSFKQLKKNTSSSCHCESSDQIGGRGNPVGIVKNIIKTPTGSLRRFASRDDNITLKFLQLKKNFGFSKGNNIGLKKTNSKSKYVLFLNPDTKVKANTIQKIINFLKKNPQVDTTTCKIILAKTNQLQPECHRGFPTPWRSFCHFSGLSKLFPKSKIFSGYFLGHLNKNKTHPIEACVGAFLIVRRETGNKINWWNEKYFFYGEDLDFCYKLKKHNFSLYYYPHCQIVHYQGISSGIKSQSKTLTKASRQTRLRSAKASTQAMRLFYKQNYFDNYNAITRFMVNSGIAILKNIRIFKAKYL